MERGRHLSGLHTISHEAISLFQLKYCADAKWLDFAVDSAFSHDVFALS